MPSWWTDIFPGCYGQLNGCEFQYIPEPVIFLLQALGIL